MRAILVLAALLSAGPAQALEPVRLLAAGSLKAAMTDIGNAFSVKSGVPVEAGFGASGLLRERIAGGEEADVFASANLEHPQAIAKERGLEVRAFARNTLCALEIWLDVTFNSTNACRIPPPSPSITCSDPGFVFTF